MPPQVKDPARRTKIFDWRVPLRSAARPRRARHPHSGCPAASSYGGTSAGPIAAIVAAGVLLLGGAAAAVARGAGAAAPAAAPGRAEERPQGGLVRPPAGALACCSRCARPSRSLAPASALRARGRRGHGPRCPAETVKQPARPDRLPLQRAGRGQLRRDPRLRPQGRSGSTAASRSTPAARARARRPLKPGLPKGTYTATYRVISADSHPVSGGLVFSIGRPSRGRRDGLGPAQGPGRHRRRDGVLLRRRARTLQYAATAIAIGAHLLPARDLAAGARIGGRRAAANGGAPPSGSPRG